MNWYLLFLICSFLCMAYCVYQAISCFKDVERMYFAISKELREAQVKILGLELENTHLKSLLNQQKENSGSLKKDCEHD